MKNEVLKKDFYEAAKAFVVAAMRLLISYLKQGENIPSTTVEKNTVEKEGSFRTDYVEQSLFSLLIFSHMKQIQDLSEYNTCVKVMREDQTISKHMDCLVGSWNVRFRSTPWMYLSHFLERQISQLPVKSEFDLEIFDRTYFDLERFFINETISSRALSPLYNFDSDVDRIELGEGLCIRRIEKRELEELVESKFSQSSIFEIMSLKYVIEFDYETKKLFGERQTGRVPQLDVNPWDKIHMLTTALRLFKSGIIGIDTIKTEQILDVPIIVSGTSSYMHGRYIGPKYYLIKAEVDDFKRFRKDFSKIDLNSLDYMGVEVRRFNYAYERGNLEDKLIDFMVAFEALFFKQGESGEFRHKLSVRVSRFLEQDYNKRRLIAEEMSDFYDARSQIVHGEKVELKQDLIKTVEDQLRRSIRLFFESLQKSDHDEIISHLDLD